VYVIGADGRQLRNLTHDSFGQSDPVWSPDGTKILFVDHRILPSGTHRWGLATMRPDGSARRFVSSQNADADQPDWESIR